MGTVGQPAIGPCFKGPPVPRAAPTPSPQRRDGAWCGHYTHQVNVVPRDGTMRTLNFLDPISSSARHVYTLPLHCHTGGGRSEDEDTPLAAAPRNQSQPDLPPGTGQLQLPPTCLSFPPLDKAPPPQPRWRVNVGTFVRELGEAHCVCVGGWAAEVRVPGHLGRNVLPTLSPQPSLGHGWEAPGPLLGPLVNLDSAGSGNQRVKVGA